MPKKSASAIDWPADKVERRKVADLIPYARNSRTHSAEQVQQIADSIKEWGWTVPVLIDPEGGIIAGHGRILAAHKLKIGDVPCMIAEGWSEAQKRAYVIADNRLAENAEWDRDTLRDELEQLRDSFDFNLDLVGFDTGELTNVFLAFEEGVTNAEEEWQGMPGYEGLEPCFRKIIVSFDDQESVDAFSELVGQDCTEKTKSIWYPKKGNRDLKNTEWADGED